MVIILAALVAGVIPAMVTIFIWAYDRIGRLPQRIVLSDDRNDGFLVGISSPLLSKEQIASTIQPRLEKVRTIVKGVKTHLKKKENSITIDEMGNLQDYLNKTGDQSPLTCDEYQDFQSLLQNVSSHLPEQQKEKFDGPAGVLRRFAAGLAIVSRIK